MREYPNRGEKVVCKIEKIMPYGVNVSIEEYDVKGFVPLGQIATRWVKNIRNFVKVGQIRVAKVMYINRHKEQVDLSFAAVNSGAENQKLNEWRQTKRVHQLLGILAKEKNIDEDELWDMIVNPILEEYNSVYEAFKDIIIYGKDYVKGIPEDLKESLFEILKKNVVINEKELSEKIIVNTREELGIEKIQELFKNMPEDESIKTSLTYIGNGTYLLRVKAIDYKNIERYLKVVNEYLTKAGKKFDKLEINRL